VVALSKEFTLSQDELTAAARQRCRLHPQTQTILLPIELSVDGNRDGEITALDSGTSEEITETRGALYNVNFDADVATAITHDSIRVKNDGTVEVLNAAIGTNSDVEDITPMLLSKIPIDLGTNYKLYLKIEDKEELKAIHIFKEIKENESPIWGRTTPQTSTVLIEGDSALLDISEYAKKDEDVELGLEGLLLAGMPFEKDGDPFDGEIEFSLEMRDQNDDVIFSGPPVKMRVAPWLMNSHQAASEKVFVDTVDGTSNNSAFRSDLGPSGQVETLDIGARWLQDHLEIGCTQRPGGPKTHLTFRLPYGSQPDWPLTKLLGADMGSFQIKDKIGTNRNAGDFGGNLEVSTPTESDPLGRIVHGSTMSESLTDFFKAQKLEQDPVQNPIEIPTAWLGVSHVDEVLGFTGNVVNGKPEILVASPARAYQLLENTSNIPEEDRGKRVFFAESGNTQIETIVGMESGSSTRIHLTTDLRGTDWKYLRIYDGTGAGQVAKIKRFLSGISAGPVSGVPDTFYVDVEQVWNTGRRVLPAITQSGFESGIYNYMFNPVNDANSIIALAALYAPEEFEAPQANGFGVDVPNSVIDTITPANGDKMVLTEDIQFWSTGAPALITVKEVLDDGNLRLLNLGTNGQGGTQALNAQERINQALSDLEIEVEVKTVPVIYVGENSNEFDTRRTGLAFTPGLANFQKSGSTFYFPKQFGPSNGNEDIFEKDVNSKVSSAVYLDDWNAYHTNGGEVHCGTNVKRAVPDDWWKELEGQQP